MVAGQIPIAASATGIASSGNLSGDVTSNATLAVTLATVNANVGVFQGLTLDAKGRVTAAVNQSYATAAAMAAADALKAPIASPVFTGSVGVGGAPADKLDVAGNLKLGATANDGAIGFGSGGLATTAGIYVGRNLDSPSGLSIGGYSGIWFHTNDTWNAPGALKAIFDSTNTRNISGAWAVISGAETKQDIEPYTRGLDAILNLNPVQFRYRPGTPFATADEPSQPLFGLIADEVRPFVPEIVGQTTMTVAGKQDVPVDCLEPGLLIFALLNAVKTLEARLAVMEGKP
jgi:hypothetical protein